jgi:uncharacterized repeat protein (TIGR01451 family)
MNRRVSFALALLAVAAVVAVAAGSPALAAGTRAGTTISNTASISYQDANGNPLSAVSNTVTTTVSQVASVTVDPNNSQGADPGDALYYAHLVTNGGNGDDTIDLTVASSQGWAVVLYADVNNNGTYEPGTDTVLVDTDGDTVPDTGLLTDDGQFRILVSVTVPAGTPDGTVDVTTVTGTSTFNTGVFDVATDTTTIAAPTVSILKSVSPAGPQAPGTVLTYTMVVTNGGTGAASSVVLTDPVPTDTTYVAGSITQDAASRTDATGDDNADSDGTTVTVSIGTLAAGASTTITFQASID